MLVFVVSSFILGHLYQFLASSALGMSGINNASWSEISAISGLSIDRAIRYFIFYFMTLLSLVCVAKSSVRSSPWGLLISLMAIPSLMSFVPFLFSDEFRASSLWALLAMLFALIFIGSESKTSSKTSRIFFFLLMATILTTDICLSACVAVAHCLQ